MDFRILRYFLNVAKEQSFTKESGTAVTYYTADTFQAACRSGGRAWS